MCDCRVNGEGLQQTGAKTLSATQGQFESPAGAIHDRMEGLFGWRHGATPITQ